ncbi:MAG TPA: hypothetical protein VG184_00970 [Acidimicrobiales bacterium]|jgi:hypothetical protein|nr:hypothetical protein [Acidimicrobiales bacterium]
MRRPRPAASAGRLRRAGWRATPSKVVAVICAAAALGAGCSVTPAPINNGAVSACFRALPTAKAAIHDSKARFQGVQRIPADYVESRLHISVLPTDTEVCAFAFRGSFGAGQVSAAPSTESGPYAVVLVTSRRLRLLRSFVGARLPSRFSHRYA